MALVKRGGGRVKWTAGCAHLKHRVGLMNGGRSVDAECGHGRGVGMV